MYYVETDVGLEDTIGAKEMAHEQCLEVAQETWVVQYPKGNSQSKSDTFSGLAHCEDRLIVQGNTLSSN